MRKFKKGFDKIPDSIKRGNKGIGYTETPSDPFARPLDVMENIRYPKGFGDVKGFKGMKESKGIGFGGFDELGSEKQIGKKAKKGQKKIRSQKQPFDFFGGLKTDF